MDKLYFILPLIFAAGYLFGRWTCGRMAKEGSGFIATTITFILLNLIHSVVDGTLLRSLPWTVYSLGMIAGHEIIRQPILYLFYFTAIAPFARPLWQKILIGMLAVTGVWIAGISMGNQLTINPDYLPDHEIALYTYVFFGGDIFHHCVDYLKHRRTKGSEDIEAIH